MDRKCQNQRWRVCFVRFARWLHPGRRLPSPTVSCLFSALVDSKCVPGGGPSLCMGGPGGHASWQKIRHLENTCELEDNVGYQISKLLKIDMHQNSVLWEGLCFLTPHMQGLRCPLILLKVLISRSIIHPLSKSSIIFGSMWFYMGHVRWNKTTDGDDSDDDDRCCIFRCWHRTAFWSLK